MKNMSLNERLNVNLEETAANRNQNQSAVPGNQPVRVIFEAFCGRWSQTNIQFTW